MKVMILCGGMGTRLREETEHSPKPMVEVGEKPILWHIMRLYTFHGFNEFILCLGYKGHRIKEYFLNFDALNNDFTIKLGHNKGIKHHQRLDTENMSVTLVDTGLETLTGGRLKRASYYLDDDDVFMLTYGDGLSDVNIAELLKFHHAHGKLATVTAVRPMSRFGVVRVGKANLVTEFSEKPVDNGWISAGFLVLNKKALKYIPDDHDSMLENEMLQNLARDGQLVAFQYSGFFMPMDTYRDYLVLNRLWKTNQASWVVWDPVKRGDIDDPDNVSAPKDSGAT